MSYKDLYIQNSQFLTLVIVSITNNQIIFIITQYMELLNQIIK
jgi:hypothetical protein